MTSEKVLVEQVIKVTVDETKFTPEFMAEFRQQMYRFNSIEDHLEHLGQLYARGLVDQDSQFIEGYGNPAAFGIKFAYMDGCESIVRE